MSAFLQLSFTAEVMLLLQERATQLGCPVENVVYQAVAHDLNLPLQQVAFKGYVIQTVHGEERVPSALYHEFLLLLKAPGNKIQAILQAEKELSLGLKQAKELVEALMDPHHHAKHVGVGKYIPRIPLENILQAREFYMIPRQSLAQTLDILCHREGLESGRLMAIKFLRSDLNSDLKTAKERVDRIIAYGLDPVPP